MSLPIPPRAIKVCKFSFYIVYFLSDTLFQELPLCCVAPGIFFGSLCSCPSRVRFFFLIVSLYLRSFLFSRASRLSFVVPIPYAVSPPLLMHLRQPPSSGPDLCMLCTWPCRGPSHRAHLSSESFFFVFVLPSLTCIRAHSLSSFPVPHPLMCYTPRHHPFPLPPCQRSRHPVWCVDALVPHFYYRL